MYGISELWTHVVADLFDGSSQNSYFDPYEPQIRRDFPDMVLRQPTLDERLAMPGPKILVTESLSSNLRGAK